MTSLSPGTTSLTGRTSFDFPLDRLCTINGKLETQGDLKVIQIKIKRGGNDITNQTSDVIVGQQISLVAEVLPTGTSSSNLSWTIQGNFVENYVASATSAAVPQLTNFSLATISFYWVNGADDRRVKHSAKVGEKTFIVEAIFNVKQPTAQITVSSNGTIQFTTLWERGLGLYFGIPTQPGMAFSSNVTIPSGFAGQTQWVQIWNKFRRVRAANGWFRSSGSGLDSVYPYSAAASTNDSPGIEFESNLEVVINESFDMYLMFQPTGLSEPTIWVPLSVVHWSWVGDATFNGASWVMNNSSKPSNPQAVSTTTHPTWTLNAANIPFNPE